MGNISIVFASDEKYAQHLCCAIKSIFMNKNADEEFSITVLSSRISESSKKIILKNISTNSTLKFVEVDNNLFKNCPLTEDAFHINSLATYYRFILSDVINDSKVLYLDCDLVVNKSLKDLYDTDITDCYIAGVEDSYRKENCERLNIEKYVNAGVLLINLDLWRKHHIQEKLFEWTINNQDKIKWQDQDVLNVVLQDKIRYLPLEFNAQVSEIEFGTTVNFNKIADNATIIHYVGNKKPWDMSSFSLNKYYMQYFKMMKWKLLDRIKLRFIYLRKNLFNLYNEGSENNKTKIFALLGFRFKFKKVVKNG